MEKCIVCLADIPAYKAYNSEFGRMCPACGALERQRVFQVVYRDYISHEYSFDGKECLIVAAAKSEKILHHGAASVKGLNIRRDIGHVDIQADVCDMPGVASNQFDSVMASYVLECVY